MEVLVSIQEVLPIPNFGPLMMLASSASNPNETSLTLLHLSLHTMIEERPPPTLPEISHDLDPPPTASHAIDPSPSTLSHYSTSDWPIALRKGI